MEIADVRKRNDKDAICLEICRSHFILLLYIGSGGRICYTKFSEQKEKSIIERMRKTI